MRRRPTALVGLLLAACSLPNPSFELLTESAGDTTAGVTSDAASTDDAASTRPDPTTEGATGTGGVTGTDGVSGTGDPTTDDATGEPSTGGSTSSGAGTDTADTTTVDTTTGPDLMVPDCAAADPSLLGCYDFEYMKGTKPEKLIDGSQYSRNGSVESADIVDGIEGTGLRILASTQIIVAADNAFHFDGQKATITAWIRPLELPADGKSFGLLDKGPDLGLRIVGGLGLACRFGPGEVESMVTPSLGVWTHLGCTYDNGQMLLFVNGTAMDGSNINDVTLEASSSPLLIGCGADCEPASRFPGVMDAVRVWNTALEPTAICAQAGALNCQ